MTKYFQTLTLTLICLFNACLYSMEHPESFSYSIDQDSLFLKAAEEGNLELIKQYLRLGKKPDEAKDVYERTALFLAVMKHAEIFNKIIKNYVNLINQAELMGLSATQDVKNIFLNELFKQYSIGMYNKIIKRLLNAGANVNARDINNDTPLLFATGKGDSLLVDLLVRYIEQ